MKLYGISLLCFLSFLLHSADAQNQSAFLYAIQIQPQDAVHAANQSAAFLSDHERSRKHEMKIHETPPYGGDAIHESSDSKVHIPLKYRIKYGNFARYSKAYKRTGVKRSPPKTGRNAKRYETCVFARK